VVVELGLLGVAEPELTSALLPVAEPVEPAVPEAPMEVPPPVLEPVVEPVLEPLAVLSVLLGLGDVVLLPELEPVMPPLGELLDGEVLEVLGEPAPVSSFLPQADRDRAAIRARAAHCAIGDLIIRNS
jgi:hypothetical protein